MSSTKFDPGPPGRAEANFRAAFERLKNGKPERLPKGTPVSQNKVAREAGVDPGALRPSRYLKLTEEIQAWVKAHEGDPSQQTPRQVVMAQRAKNRGLKEQMAALKVQRDDALSKLVGAEARIVDLTIQNERLRAKLPAGDVVTPIRPSEKK